MRKATQDGEQLPDWLNEEERRGLSERALREEAEQAELEEVHREVLKRKSRVMGNAKWAIDLCSDVLREFCTATGWVYATSAEEPDFSVEKEFYLLFYVSAQGAQRPSTRHPNSFYRDTIGLAVHYYNLKRGFLGGRQVSIEVQLLVSSDRFDDYTSHLCNEEVTRDSLRAVVAKAWREVYDCSRVPPAAPSEWNTKDSHPI